MYFLKGRLSVCNQTKLIHVTHLPYDIVHKWVFFYPDPTSHITSLSPLFSLSSNSATCLHSTSFFRVLSQQPSKKSNPLPLLMGCDIALIVSVLQRWLQSVAKRQLTPRFYSVNYSIWTGHYQNELYQITWLHYALCNYSYHQGISICKLGEISTLYMRQNDTAL